MTTLDLAKTKLASIIFRDSPGTSFLLVFAGWLMCIGFLVGSTNNNYEALTALMPFYGWAAVFFIYSTAKSYSLVFRRYAGWLEVLVSGIGIWAWNYIFLSFTVYDKVPTAPTELLLFVPVLAEVWSLTSDIFYKGNCGGRN